MMFIVIIIMTTLNVELCVSALSLSIVFLILGISHLIFFQVVIANEIESLVESLFMEEYASE